MNPINQTSEFWALCIAFVCGFLLVGALIMEYHYGLVPCPLCLMQRLWFAAVGLLALVALFHNPRLGIYPVLTGLAAICGASFAIRQLWLQSLPADQVPACGPDIDYMIQAFPMADVVSAMMNGTGDCAEVVWQFLGISIPGWALIGFITLLALCVMQWRSKRWL